MENKFDSMSKFGGVAGASGFSLPGAKVSVFQHDITALLDSGSSLNLLSVQAYEKMSVTVKLPPLVPSDVSCTSANSSPIPILGVVKLKIHICQFSWYIQFYVVKDLVVPMVLGYPFFQKSGIVLDFAERLYYFQFQPRCTFSFEIPSNRCVYTPKLDNLLLGDVGTGDVTAVVESATEKFPHLSEGQSQILKEVIDKYSDVLTDRLGLTHVIEHEIELVDKNPVRRPPYRLSPPKMKFLRKEIQSMLDKGIIQPSTSNYSSPMFLVPKGENNFRPVVDYRFLNSKIEIESVPLPDIHSCFSWFSQAKYFTSLDLNQAYFQIPLSAQSRKLTAFCTDWNLFEFTRVPFGLATGAQVLTRLLDKIFSDIKFEYVFHYLDDVVIY